MSKQAARPGQISIALPEAMLVQLRGMAKILHWPVADLIRRSVSAWLISNDAKTLLESAESSLAMQSKIANFGRNNLSENSEK